MGISVPRRQPHFQVEEKARNLLERIAMTPNAPTSKIPPIREYRLRIKLDSSREGSPILQPRPRRDLCEGHNSRMLGILNECNRSIQLNIGTTKKCGVCGARRVVFTAPLPLLRPPQIFAPEPFK
jgi:hypothetical protein